MSQSSVCVCCKATLTGNYADDFDDDASDDDYDDDEFKEDEAADESNSSAYSVEEDILVWLYFLFFSLYCLAYDLRNRAASQCQHIVYPVGYVP